MKATSLLFVHLPVYTVSAPSALIFSSFIFVGVEPFEQWNLQSFFIHFFFLSSFRRFTFSHSFLGILFTLKHKPRHKSIFFAFHKLMNNGSKSRKADTK